jgi:hypothetical protein
MAGRFLEETRQPIAFVRQLQNQGLFSSGMMH